MPSTDRLILSIVFRLRVEGNQKNLSQTDFGLLVGLTREQMAHGASDPRNNPSSTKTIVRTSPMNMNIFDLVCSHGK